MILYPAIDILDGKAVRLVEGRFEDQTIYHDDPLEAAKSWVDAGARFLHVVDLDGARSGEPRSIEHLRRIAKETGGESYIATDGKALADSMHKVLDSLEKTNFEASIGSFEDLFQLLLIPGVLLVGLDALLRGWLLRRFP